MSKIWDLKGFMGLTKIGEGKVLLEFASKGETSRVLQKGVRNLPSFKLDLCRWSPNEGCLSSSISLKELWVWLVGLPTHL